jgi:MFS family permease
LAGSLLAERFTKLLGEGPAVYASIAMSIVAELVAFLTHNGYVAGAAFALIGFGSIVWNVLTVSLRQEIIPPRLLGRVNSAYRFVGWGSMPIGALIGGLIAHVWGLRAPFLFATVMLTVCGLLMTRAVTSRTIAAARAEAAARVS